MTIRSPVTTVEIIEAERRYRATRGASQVAKARYLELRAQRHSPPPEVQRARTLWLALESECGTLERVLLEEGRAARA